MSDTYFQAGFLSQRSKDDVEYFNRLFREWRVAYEELNLYACGIRKAMKVGKLAVHIYGYYVSIYNRMLDAYQCVWILLERGAHDEAKGVLRGMLESLFLIEASRDKKTFAYRYTMDDLNSQLHMLEQALKASMQAKRLGKPQFWNEVERANARKIINDLKSGKLKSQRRWVKSSKKPGRYAPKKNAIAAGSSMVFEYKKAYHYLCAYSHTSVSGTLSKYIEFGKVENKLTVGPNWEESDKTMQLSMEYILMALTALNEVFSLGQSATLMRVWDNIQKIKPVDVTPQLYKVDV